MAREWYDTAANIISDAALGLGLVTAAIADPYASTDANVLRLNQELKDLGQDLLRDFEWQQLQKTHTFSTVNGTAAYDFPADYNRMASQSEWNRTQQWPLLGPASLQEWQQLKAMVSSGLVRQVLRVFNDQVNIHPTPTAAETVAFEYASRYWVKPTGQSAPTSEAPTAAADTLYFDRRLLVTGLKLRFLGEKGFDTSFAQDFFDRAQGRAQGGNNGAPVLSLNGSRGRVRLLDGRNVPETGFGS